MGFLVNSFSNNPLSHIRLGALSLCFLALVQGCGATEVPEPQMSAKAAAPRPAEDARVMAPAEEEPIPRDEERMRCGVDDGPQNVLGRQDTPVRESRPDVRFVGFGVAAGPSVAQGLAIGMGRPIKVAPNVQYKLLGESLSQMERSTLAANFATCNEHFMPEDTGAHQFTLKGTDSRAVSSITLTQQGPASRFQKCMMALACSLSDEAALTISKRKSRSFEVISWVGTHAPARGKLAHSQPAKH